MGKVELALELTIDYLSSEGIYVDSTSTKAKIEKWHDAAPAIDFISLASLALADPNECVISPSEIREIRDFFFPSKNFIERSLF